MARVGWVTCGVCGNPEASVTENAAGTLSVSCHKCQYSGYAKAGTKAARMVRANMAPDDEAPPAAKPAPAPTQGKKTPPASPAGRGFDLGAV